MPEKLIFYSGQHLAAMHHRDLKPLSNPVIAYGQYAKIKNEMPTKIERC